MTSFKHEKKPEKLQYFGSTSIRFKHNKKKTIGPGNYEVTDNYSKDNISTNIAPFLSM
jgi:hypothetical protein